VNAGRTGRRFIYASMRGTPDGEIGNHLSMPKGEERRQSGPSAMRRPGKLNDSWRRLGRRVGGLRGATG